MVDSALLQELVQVVDALVHTAGLVGADADVQQAHLFVEVRREVVALAGGARAPSGAAEAAYPVEHVLVVKAYGIGLETAQRQAADGPVVAVGDGAVVRVDVRDDLLDHHLLEGVEVEHAGGLMLRRIGERRGAALHHDDHRDGFLGGDHIVHNIVELALGAPTSLVLARSVEQVEHGILLVGLQVIVGREIDVAGPPGLGKLGPVFLDTDLSVRYFLLEVIVHAGLGYLDAAGPVARAEEETAVRVGDPDAVDGEGIIVESRDDGVCRDGPETVLTLSHRIITAEVYGYALGLGSRDAELDAEVGIDLGILVSEDVGGSAGGLGDDAKIRVCRAFRALAGGCDNERSSHDYQ